MANEFFRHLYTNSRDILLCTMFIERLTYGVVALKQEERACKEFDEIAHVEFYYLALVRVMRKNITDFTLLVASTSSSSSPAP